jgi:hypothetical protein
MYGSQGGDPLVLQPHCSESNTRGRLKPSIMASIDRFRELERHILIRVGSKARQPYFQRALEQTHASIEGLGTNRRAEPY